LMSEPWATPRASPSIPEVVELQRSLDFRGSIHSWCRDQRSRGARGREYEWDGAPWAVAATYAGKGRRL